MKALIRRIHTDLRPHFERHKKKLGYLIPGFLGLIPYMWSRSNDSHTAIYRENAARSFKDARVLGRAGENILEGRERIFSKTTRDLKTTQAELQLSYDKLRARLDELEKAKASAAPPGPGPAAGISPSTQGLLGVTSGAASEGAIRLNENAYELGITQVGDHQPPPNPPGHRILPLGATIISFPVKATASASDDVALPAGSYVKAKLMTGVEAPEGRTYPVLLELDYAYIVPNRHRVDLSGCFMIAKSQGDLSTERVQMQATKLSCVSKTGRMFERDVSGFIADDKDNSFAVVGSVNSKQDRVASMAFLSSIVEGVGKALQQAQSSTQTNALGGTQSAVTGDQGTYLLSGGASNAASLVTQWYLKQAQNLLPTINIGSGRDVWIVMQETAKLPKDFFRSATDQEGGQSESVFSYFSRTAE